MNTTPPLHARWQVENAQLITTIQTADYKSAVLLVNAIAFLAEQQQHHPTMMLGYNHLHIRITTHDVGRLTEKDHRLAIEIDRLLAD